jgi:hypothetical protein
VAEHSASFLVHRLEGWWIEEIPTAAVRQNHYQQGRQPAANQTRLTRLRLAFRARARQLPWAKKRRRYPRSPRHFPEIWHSRRRKALRSPFLEWSNYQGDTRHGGPNASTDQS